MESFTIRVNNARKDFMNMEGDLWEKIEKLWRYGYSLRVISEITGVSRSKLQRFFSENELNKEDDIRTQNRNTNVYRTKKLWENGATKEEIASVLGLNVRTIESYLKQLGYYERSVFF